VHILANLGGLVAISGMERVEPDLLLGALLEVADRLPKMKAARLAELRQRGPAKLERAPRAEPPAAVKKVISVRSQARGLANDRPIARKPGLRCGVLREPSRLPRCSERCPTARGLAA
jgi:hypothetical protein